MERSGLGFLPSPESWAVVADVGRHGHNFQITWAVICFISVLVMNNLEGLKWAPEIFFHDKAVFQLPMMTADRNANVSVGSFVFPFSPIPGRISAGVHYFSIARPGATRSLRFFDGRFFPFKLFSANETHGFHNPIIGQKPQRSIK
jgi:hypothetical protein